MTNEPAKEKPKSQEITVPTEPWVTAIVKDPGNVPSVILLWGYVGDSPEDKHIRLYFDGYLSRCVDVPLEEILHREGVPAARSSLGGSYLWVNRTGWTKLKWYYRYF